MPKKYLDFSKAIKDLGGKLLYINMVLLVILLKVFIHFKFKFKPNYAVKIVKYPEKENY